jgi:hypothetical protein
MYKPNNKKMLTVLISIAMIFSAFAVLSFVATPAYASASGTVIYNPSTLGVGTLSSGKGIPVTTVALTSGGTFSSGDTIYFYLSTTDSSTGLVQTYGSDYFAIGVTVLSASSPTSLNQAVTFFPTESVPSVYDGTSYYAAAALAPGTYYILASDQIPTSITSPSALTSFAFPGAATQLVVQSATLTIWNAANDLAATGSNALLVGGTGIAYGTGFDSGASVTVSLSYPGGTVLVSTTADASGGFSASFTVPTLAGTYGTGSPDNTYLGPPSNAQIPYTAVAEETNAYSSSYPQGGITADSSFDVGPSLTVSPADYNGAAGSTLTLTGTGFPGGATMTSSSTTSPSTSIEITNYGLSTGGTNTYHAAVTVSSTGTFTVSVTTVSALSTTGPYSVYIQMSDTSPYATSINELFYPAVFVSVPNPQAPGFYFLPSPDSVTSDYYPTMSALIAAVYDFPAGATVSVYIGSTLLGSVTTDSLGYAMLSASTVPAMPAGSYVVTAVDSTQGLATVPTSPSSPVGTTTNQLVLTALFSVSDPIANSLVSALATTAPEYVPQNGTLTVSAFGLAPQTEYAPTDTAGVGNIAEYGTSVTVLVGSVATDGLGFVPASNGSLIFTYQPYYGTYVTTGTLDAITISGVTGFEGKYYNYYEIGAATISPSGLSTHIQTVGSSVTVTVTNLIPASGKTVTQYYPGTSDQYNLYIGSTEIVSTPPTLSKWTGTVIASGIIFDVPSLANGLYNVSVVYAGQAVSNALPQETTATAMLVVSSAGSSSGSGSIEAVSVYSQGSFAGYVILGYGLLSTTSVDLAIYNSLGLHTGSVTSTSPDGAFFDSTDLAATGSIYADSSAGTFGIVLTINPGTASASEFYATYSVSASLFFSDASSPVGYSAGVFYDLIGNTVTLTAGSQSGLTAGTYYDLYFGATYLKTVEAVSATSFGSGVTFIVPIVPYGMYNVSITDTGTTTTVASAPFDVLWDYHGTGYLMDAAGNYIDYAFPSQLVSFSWTPTTVPGSPASPSAYGPVTVTVYLNGTAYASTIATDTAGTLTGSFVTPNSAPGTYWGVGFGWSQIEYESSTLGGSALTSTPTSYIDPSMAYLGLVEGNGAFLTGITAGEIAILEADINGTVSTSLSVPISQLDAAITSINGAVATLKTTVGNISVDLSTINATVASIESGQVLVQTELGSVLTSFASLNSSIATFNGDVATINTTLGNVQTSVGSILTKVTENGNGIVTIQTDLGTYTGTVTSVSGGIASIQTALGTMQTNVSSIQKSTSQIPSPSTYSNLNIFLIVIIVLVLITLVLAFLAISSVNKVARKLEEQKKQ